MVHLLGESLHDLDEHYYVLFSDQKKGHKFPIGVTLCVVGLLFTLGMELLVGIVMKINMDPISVDEQEGMEHENIQLISECETGTKEAASPLSLSSSSYIEEHKYGSIDQLRHTEKRNNSKAKVTTNAAGIEPPTEHFISQSSRSKSVLKSSILEVGIFLHSVIIGISVAAIQNYTELSVLIVAVCFHQWFEGISLGTMTVQARFSRFVNACFAFFFVISLPLGIVIGISFPTGVYSKAVQACIQCFCAGSLLYTVLVEMVAEDFASLQIFHDVCTSGQHKHNRWGKSRCKECGGSAICEHGRLKYSCKECGGSGICEHDRRKSKCKECGGS